MPPVKFRSEDRPHLLVEVARTVIEHPSPLFLGIRAMIGGFQVEVPRIPETTLEQTGYGRNKLPQLFKNYWNEAEAVRVRDILSKRSSHEFTSVAMSMRNGSKDSRSMGWCMCSIVVTRVRKGLETVTVQYRSTELTKKFGGDLVFLPMAFERLGLKPDRVRFQFANAFLSGVYFPYLSVFWPGGAIDLLRYLEAKNDKFFRGSTRFFLRSACRRDARFPYSPEAVAHEFAWRKLDMPHIKDYLLSRYRERGDRSVEKYLEVVEEPPPEGNTDEE